MFIFFSSSARSRYSPFSCHCDKPDGHSGCDFVLHDGKSFLVLSTSALACPDSAMGSSKVTCFASLTFVTNTSAGFLLLVAES
jgi:hypothetical protein